MRDIYNIFPLHLRSFIEAAFSGECKPEEIRLRVGQPLVLDVGQQEFFWDEQTEQLIEGKNGKDGVSGKAYRITERDLQEVTAYMSNYSLYAFEEEVRAGFLTIQGGHRIGIAGKAVCENGMIKTIRHICFLNIRIAGQQKDCAREILPYLMHGQSIYNTLILSPPGGGKTTFLRDCIRLLSEGSEIHEGMKVGVVDERSEIAACYMGIPQNDIGPRTDVLDCCPKAQGIQLLLRSMSPEIIGVDELGGQADYEAVEYALYCGCRLLGTIHGTSLEELKQKPYMERWMSHGMFERYVIIHRGVGKDRKFSVYNERQEQIC